MSNKQRPAWRPWAYASVLLGPLVITGAVYWYMTDRSTSALIAQVHGVALPMWFVLLAAAWLRAQKQQSKALRHALTLRARTDGVVASMSMVTVERALHRAQDDLATVAVMWHALFIVFGVVSLLVHFT